MTKMPRGTAYVIKAEVREPRARSFRFDAQKTMYGGRKIAAGDWIYVFASENERGAGGGRGRHFGGAEPRVPGALRQTPRVSIVVRRTGLARRRLGRAELNRFRGRDDGCPESELDFKLYRQATNKIVGISPETAEFLRGFFV